MKGHVHTHGAWDRDRPGEEKTPLARLDRRFGGLVIYQWLRPLMIGIVHGLAGSAAVALLVFTLVRDPLWAFTYLLLFGAGTICGMMVITLGLSAPFARSRAGAIRRAVPTSLTAPRGLRPEHTIRFRSAT